MSKILVTGGAGFLGSHLVKSLIDDSHEVFVLDAFNQYIIPPVSQLYVYNLNYRFDKLINQAEIIRCDTKNKDDVRRKVSAAKPDYIIHCAALPLANMAIEYSEEAFNTIVGGTVNLLEILRDGDYLSRFVYISSSMVYGDFEKTPIFENCKKEPKEIYGGMKLAGEYMVKVYSQRYNIPYSIIRPSAVYGSTDNNNRVVGVFLTRAIQGEKVKVKNAKDTMLDFSYVEDVAEGIKKVTFSQNGENEIFNITRGKSRSLEDLIKVINELYPALEVEYIKEDTFRPKRGTLDVSKAKRLVEYSPKIDIEEGIKAYSQFLEVAFNSL